MEVCVYHALDSINEINRKMPEVTLRDLFAMHALNGLMVQNESMESPDLWNYDALASCAYEAADAMLKARKHK